MRLKKAADFRFSSMEILLVLLLLLGYSECAPSASTNSSAKRSKRNSITEVPCPSGIIDYDVDGGKAVSYRRNSAPSSGGYEDQSKNGSCFVAMVWRNSPVALEILFNSVAQLNKQMNEYDVDYLTGLIVQYRGRPDEMYDLKDGTQLLAPPRSLKADKGYDPKLEPPPPSTPSTSPPPTCPAAQSCPTVPAIASGGNVSPVVAVTIFCAVVAVLMR